jgi:DNA-binding CsgD family transcriptional regulator
MYAGRGEEAADVLERAMEAVADDETALIVDATLLGSAFLEPQLMARVAALPRRQPPDPQVIRTPGERSWAAGRAVAGITLGKPRAEIREMALAAAGDGALVDALGADAPPLNMALGALWWIDAHDDVLAIAGHAVAVGLRDGPPRAVALAGTMVAAAHQRLGNLPAAIEHARAALELMYDDRELELVSWLASAMLVEALVDAGRSEEAAAALEAQRDRRGASSLLADAYRHAEGRDALARGDAETACEAFDDCGVRMRRWGVRTTPLAAWRVGKARALHALGLRDEALEVAAEDLQVSGPASERARGMALAVLGEVTGGAAGIERLREGVAALEAAGARVEHARALLALGRLLSVQDEAREARAALRQGAALALAGGAQALVAQADDALRAAGARPSAAGHGELTPTERRVADLAAAGHGNREIAAALGVTIRTVETHLTRIYDKLGISGRGELPGT